MQFLAYIWHVASRLGKALVLNPPSLPIWAAWFTLIIRTVVVLVIFRRNVAPFLLARISRRIRARSISVLSIKGLYFCSAGRTWRVERIGWSLHPWAESRVSVKIEGLRIEIAKPRIPARRNYPYRHRSTVQSLITPLVVLWNAMVALERLLERLCMSSLFSGLRIALSSFFILVARFFVRCLPSLTQSVDFDLDSVVISFEALPGAHVTFQGITLGTKVDFSQMDKEVEALVSSSAKVEPNTGRTTQQNWNAVFRGGADRFWERIWGQTEGFAVVDVNIREIVGRIPPSPTILQPYQSCVSTGNESLNPDDHPFLDPRLPSNVFLRVAAPLRILVSSQFSPKHLALVKHCLSFSLNIPTIDFSVDGVVSLLNLISQGKDPTGWFKTTSFKTAQSRHYEQTSQVSPSISPLPASPISPTSPFMSAFSQMARKRGSVSSPAPPVKRLREPKVQPLVTALKSIEVCFSSIGFFYSSDTSLHEGTSDRCTYLCRLDSLVFRLGLSSAISNQLQRKWLGSKDPSALDGMVYGVTLDIALTTISRLFLERSRAPAKLIVLRKLGIDLIAHQWPLIRANTPQFLSGDPNGPFVACEMSITGLEATEQLDELQTSINSVMPAQRASSPKSIPTTVYGVPRIEFHFVCADIQARLSASDPGSAQTTQLLVFQTPGFSTYLSTYFRIGGSKPVRSVSSVPDNCKIYMETAFHVFLQPSFIRLGLTHGPENGKNDNEGAFENPYTLLGVDSVELSMTGNTSAYLGIWDIVVLETDTFVMEARCITDGVSFDLWNAESIAATRVFVEAVMRRDTVMHDSPPPKSLNSLRAGMTVHLAIGSFTGVITGQDLNPRCGLELFRGLELRTGISIQYCCMQAAHHSRHGKLRFAQARDREQLGLPENILIQATAEAKAGSEPEDISALVQIVTWQTTCLTALSTRYEYGAGYNPVDGDKGVFVLIPRTVVKARLRRRGQTNRTSSVSYRDTCGVSVNIVHIRGRLDLLNAYSALLALHTIKQVFPRHSNTGVVREASDLQVTVGLRVGSAHIFCHMPLHERIFIRMLSVSLQQNPNATFKVECNSIVGWVSSAQFEGKWEELLRICGSCISVARPSAKLEVAIIADGLRIAIPHRFILSDLILNVGIGVKALRHIRHIVQLGHYIPLPSPAAEDSKRLPVIDIVVRSVTLEAADSPFEAKLGLIWRAGYQAQKTRIERELAFEAKLRAILASGDSEVHVNSTPQSDLRYHFTSKRTTSVTDARNRLNMVHSSSWISSITREKEEIGKKEDTILRQLRYSSDTVGLHIPIPIAVHNPGKVPPLFRAVISKLSVSLSPPTFHNGYESFLAELGNMPTSTAYSLLIPMHIKCYLDAAMMNIRDYPLPLINVPSHANGPSLVFLTDLVIAEEMGSGESVEWLDCPIVPRDAGIVGASEFLVRVPKTIMPVKSYADPELMFCTAAVTEFTWGVSYNPAVQEVMRVIETLSHPPRDPSPAIGFWDKLRLVFHWRITATFKEGAQLHFKGSRDPYHIIGVGAGFDFRWNGNVAIKVGHENPEKELIQLSSDSMVITIPDHKGIDESTAVYPSKSYAGSKKPFTAEISPIDRKICAKFSNGIRWGIGLSLERTCDSDCKTCTGDTFNRKCRFFTFVPHYNVVLRSNNDQEIKDSYSGFRSDFIHFSTSLTSPIKKDKPAKHNSFHLTPRTFAHFWSWWHLFDSVLSLPIRQGSLFPESRPPSKKFGRHLATIKYRIIFSSLYITHVYKVDSGEAWAAGESHCVGVKAFLEHFQADLHQREEESIMVIRGGDESKTLRHKPFSAVDVVITGLDLRAVFAVFAEPIKKTIPLRESLPGSTRFWESLEPIPLSSTWVDADDFIEIDWIPIDEGPQLYFHEAAHCPRFVYFKRTTRAVTSQGENGIGRSKFGDENTHTCLMGKEPSAHEVQHEFGAKRLAELRAMLADPLRMYNSANNDTPTTSRSSAARPSAARETSISQMITLLERYTQHLSNLRTSSLSNPGETGHKVSDDIYDMPTDIKLPQELGEFANVFQVHCPQIHLNNATRDILQKYYLASRARRGYEYHMSARAVKFIRDQAHTTRAESLNQNTEKRRPRAGSAQAAAQAVRRMLTGDERKRNEDIQRHKQRTSKPTNTDPLYGWDQGVSERKAHLCLLLKPQIVMRSKRSARSVLALAADHVVLRNYGILDIFNADDPVSGYVMQRNYADINSLQVFRPIDDASANHLPLEVFLDFRCESRDFDRLVPQTNAILRYDKFNRLRLRNNVTTVAISHKDGDMDMVDHLLHETDLVIIQVPRFSISADASAFASISDIVTDLLLFSDPVYKARMTQLETMLFSYDFTDLPSAAKVVADLQSRIRRLVRIEGAYGIQSTRLTSTDDQDLLASKAHILTLSEELNLIFDAIRLAQDKIDDRNQEKKSALRLQVVSSEISWQMLDEGRELLAKLAVRGLDYSWLSRQDSSTMSVLSVADLQAFDGSPSALLPEILAKHDDPPMHRMIRRGIFAEARWSVLAPVGGISIYDHFVLELHPIRLALETQLGNKLVDYLIPGRRYQQQRGPSDPTLIEASSGQGHSLNHNLTAESLVSLDDDIPSTLQLTIHPPQETVSDSANTPTTRHVSKRKDRPIASRSFSNLRSAAAESQNKGYYALGLPKSSSSTALVERRGSMESEDAGGSGFILTSGSTLSKADGDALEMRHRSAQKTFVHVEIPSVHVLLSVMKGRGFLVRNARLRTHDLEWRNRTASFEELISQFIPSDPSLRGWVKVAWQQPVFSVGGVVKELITKTQWGRLGRDSEPSKRKNNEQSLEEGAVQYPLPRSSVTSSAGDQPFPTQATEGDNRSCETVIHQSHRRSRSTSRARVSSLFRRTGKQRSSVESVEVAAIPKFPT